MYQIKNYVKPATLDEAFELNKKKQNRIIAGNMWLRLASSVYDTLIDISELGLDKIEETPDKFIIGAMVSLRELELDPALAAAFDNTIETAVKSIVGTQFRNTATIGGSIWGRFGFSDILTLLLAFDTEVCLYKGGTIPLRDFISMPYDRDILTHIIIHKNITVAAYQTLRNQATDFPVIACALTKGTGGCRLTIGARPGKAVLYTVPKLSSEADFSIFLEKAVSNTIFGTNIRASAEYRQAMAAVLLKRLWKQINEKEAH